MSRKGNCWDNAVMERFFGPLKRECTAQMDFATHQEARMPPLALDEALDVDSDLALMEWKGVSGG